MCHFTSLLPPTRLCVCLPVCPCVGHVYLYCHYGLLNSVRLFRARLPALLVYVLGKTIWPQVLSAYFKPSVSLTVLTVSRLSSRFQPPLPIPTVRLIIHGGDGI